MRPIQKSFAARRELRHTQSDMVRLEEEEEGTTAEGDTLSAAAKKATAAALAKFHNAIELSAQGLALLRRLHKQVRSLLYSMYSTQHIPQCLHGVL